MIIYNNILLYYIILYYILFTFIIYIILPFVKNFTILISIIFIFFYILSKFQYIYFFIPPGILSFRRINKKIYYYIYFKL